MGLNSQESGSGRIVRGEVARAGGMRLEDGGDPGGSVGEAADALCGRGVGGARGTGKSRSYLGKAGLAAGSWKGEVWGSGGALAGGRGRDSGVRARKGCLIHVCWIVRRLVAGAAAASRGFEGLLIERIWRARKC